jgi:hypothetical protein
MNILNEFMRFMILLLGFVATGCGSSTQSNLSPTPEQSADRHQQAIRYSERVARENGRAEQKAMSRMARSFPQKPR